MTALGKHGGAVLQRPVFEAVNQAAGHAIAANGLNEIAACQQGALRRAQREKAVREPLDVSHRDRLGQGNPNQEQERGCQ